MLNIQQGDLFEVTEGIIAHQVNCQGVMGGGVASYVKGLYPHVYQEYKKLCKSHLGQEDQLLGCVQVVVGKQPSLYVANCFSQLYYGNYRKYTIDCAYRDCFRRLKQISSHQSLPVYIPRRMGAGLAGGDWAVLASIIQEEFPEVNVLVRKEEEDL